jgi:hypothetical protein
VQLEARLTAAEAEASLLRKQQEATHAELAVVRSQRDDLMLAIEAAKSAAADASALKEEAARSSAEAKRARADADKATAEAETAKADADRAKAELEKARAAARVAEDDAAIVGDQASKIRDEAAKTRLEADKAREDLIAVETELGKAREDRVPLEKALESARKDLQKARDDLAKSKDDNARDRATARDRIDLLDTALDDARTSTSHVESQLEKARANEDHLARELEKAVIAAAAAEARAAAMTTAHGNLENSLRRLREEIANAFARVGHAPPAPSEPEPITAPTLAKADSIPPVNEDDWSADDDSHQSIGEPELHVDVDVESEPTLPSTTPASGTPTFDGEAPSPVSKSVSPPAASGTSIGSKPPPQAHEPAPSCRSPLMALALRKASEPPPANDTSMEASGLRKTSPPPAPEPDSVAPVSRQPTLPPVAGASMPPPPPAIGSVHPSPLDEMPPSGDWSDASPPPTRRPGSGAPPPFDAVQDAARSELLARLVDPSTMHDAVVALREHPDWLLGTPPSTFVAALATVDYNADVPIFGLARAWEREPLCRALIASLRSETDMRLREHSAWLLKHLAAPSSWKAIAEIASSDEEPGQLRRWLLEALDRLAAGRAIGWRELGDLVTSLAKNPDSSLRDGVVGILVSLDRSDEKRKLLLEILRSDDDEDVLASAVNALASVLPMDLDAVVGERLLGHPSPLVQRSVKDLVERMKQTRP